MAARRHRGSHKKPLYRVCNCETANRRVDVTEFIAWAKACDIRPEEAFSRLLDLI